jgi:hypothetical protein
MAVGTHLLIGSVFFALVHTASCSMCGEAWLSGSCFLLFASGWVLEIMDALTIWC